jgi:glycosidase
MKFAARSVLIALAVATGCGDASVDGTNGNGYPPPPPPPFDAGTGGAGGTGPGATGGSGAQPPTPPPDGGGKGGADARDAAPQADRGQDSLPPMDSSLDRGADSDGRPPVPEAGLDAPLPDGGPVVDGSTPPPPFNWRDGIIYYIFVDRFLDSNAQNNCVVPGVSPSEVSADPASPAQYRGGDWAGITAKINDGYFQSLGVNALMITSPMTNVGIAGQGIEGDTHNYSAYHGYWPTSVDPMTPSSCFGTRADLAALVSAAHANKLMVLFDHTIVHVHVTSDIYTQHSNWFWTNGGQPWCTCGTTGCDWDPVAGQGLKCWFTDYLPHWNYGVAEARDFAKRMTLDWITQYGIDGLRLDAIKHVDESWLLDTRSAITAEVAPQRPDSPIYLVGETVDGNIANIAKYVDPVTKLDGQFDFPTRAQIVRTVLRRGGQMSDLATFMDQNADAYGPSAVMSTILGTHDMMRVIHHAENVPVGSGEWDDGKGTTAPRVAGWTTHPNGPSTIEPYERLANGFAVLFTNKGAPLIYYGDEVGLAGAGDPDNRRMMPWSGIGTEQQWLHDRMAKLLQIRKAHTSTRSGTRTTLLANQDVWVYSLSDGSDQLYVVINRGDTAQSVTLGVGNLTELVVGGPAGSVVSVPARQTRIYQP